MRLVYTPSISTLWECPSEYVSRLTGFFKHELDREYLATFEKIKDLPFTPAYSFRAEEDDKGTYTVKIYSGFIKTILEDIYSGHSGINKKDFSMVSTRHKYNPSDTILSETLYSHQKRIVKSILQNKRGIVKSPTGSGKSFVIAELVRKFTADNLKILITVPTIDLLHQLENNIHEYMNINNISSIKIGKVGDGNYNFANITIGIPQSLCKIEKTAEYLRGVDVLISDEVHTCTTPTFGIVAKNAVNTAVRIGLSATPGDNIFLTAFFGPRIINIKESEMIDNDIIMEPLIKFLSAPKAFIPKPLAENALRISTLTTGHRYKTYSQVYNRIITNNSKRNNLIVDTAVQRINLNLGPVIIIVNKIKGNGCHGEIIQSMLENKGYTLPIISGYISKKKREKILNNLKDNSIVGCVAGPKVLTAGINIPSLSTIILCGAGKSDAEFIQRVGRLLRKKEGKERPVVFDFIDTQYWFNNQSNSRLETAKNIYGESNITII